MPKFEFVGQGKGIIDAKGNVNLAFMKNQTVKSRQNVVIAKEAIHCAIFARKTIVVHGNPYSIAGGKIMARDSITAFSIGNGSGVKTLLEVGVDFSLLEELEKTESQLAAMIENKRKLTLTSAKYQHAIDGKTKPGGGEESLVAKLKDAFTKFDQQIALLEERKKIVVANVYELKNAHIVIEHAAFPERSLKSGRGCSRSGRKSSGQRRRGWSMEKSGYYDSSFLSIRSIHQRFPFLFSQRIHARREIFSRIPSISVPSETVFFSSRRPAARLYRSLRGPFA